MNPLVSIVIDNYNYGRFLPYAIDSALGQTYSRVEVIVVDDGSTDNSREVVAKYAGRIMPVLQENAGQASALNSGFTASHGDIVLFLDADDSLAPTAVERAVPLFDGQDVVKVHWPLWLIDRHGHRTGAKIPHLPLAEGNLREDIIRDGPLRYTTSPTSGNAWAKWYLSKVFPVQECGNKHGGDAYLSILAPLFGKIRKVDEAQGCYRVHDQNFSGVDPKKQRPRPLLEYHCRLLREHLRAEGIEADEKSWKKLAYLWEYQTKQAAKHLRHVLLAGCRYILIDEDQFGGTLCPGRSHIPFLERDGVYYGLPLDNETAIQELERLRRGGASFLVFTWPTFWWLQHYASFHQHLRSRFPCVLENELVIVFDLRDETGGWR